MNDLDEVRHGLRLLMSCLGDSAEGAKLRAALDAFEPGFADFTIEHFKAFKPIFPDDTLITCLSEQTKMKTNMAGCQCGAHTAVETAWRWFLRVTESSPMEPFNLAR
ncbi:hypothetical protein [Cupriavidus sp. IK-TO18]|uniref:hypothetical protein n=1 Tax=Cupriavidus sp. IK-TO18 TaxID=2782182 RepID=UPI0018985330|nr:hypothetical protein [Cupriavidus sp. IK-TO18]MBF6986491.1 hypothetical protein [Cupriavidus sp. IK-TO18]